MKTTRYLLCAVVVASLIVIATVQSASAQTTVQLSGSVSAEALRLPNYGDLPSARNLPLQISFKPRNQAQLNALLAAQQNPKSPQYHRWLTPDEYGSRFGITQADFDKISRWLTNEGFQVTGGSAAQGYIKFNGSVLTIARAFNTRITKFSTDGARFGNLSEPQIPSEYAGLIATITGLSNTQASKPMNGGALTTPATPSGRSSRLHSTLLDGFIRAEPLQLAALEQDPELIVSGQGPALAPSDFNTFYGTTTLRNQGITGAVDCIAIIGDSDFRTSPIATFNNQFGITDNSGSITKVLATPSSPTINGDEVETLLDLEWSHAVAPGAAIKYFYGSNASSSFGLAIIDALQAAVNDNTCSVISISFGICGGSASFYTGTINAMMSQAAAQGQTVLVSSGDDGAAGIEFNGSQCQTGTTANVNELASSQYVTSVGGTSFSDTAFNGPSNSITAHTTERVWNDRHRSRRSGLERRRDGWRKERILQQTNLSERSHSQRRRPRSTGRCSDCQPELSRILLLSRFCGDTGSRNYR